jgi:hypothetical protein
MRWGWGLGGLALLVLAMLGDTLVGANPPVLGAPGEDLASQFLPWRYFGFGELAHGNLPLWNPYIFAGAPFFGGMQSALLYPVNWLHLVLPLPLASNWTAALNLWLLGAFVFLWARQRGLHPFASGVAGALATFGAPCFLRVYAGHSTAIAAMPWAALLFLAIDGWLATRRPAWCLLGMLAVAMQILAGHPQYVYLTALATACYSLARLAEPRERRLGAAAGLLSFHSGGALLAALQLVAGMQATAETVRGQALPLFFAGAFSFPPENFVTLVAPGFFGDTLGHPYWGRWYLWEASAFMGVCGLALAAYGAAGKVPGKAALVLTGAASTLLALGEYTPLHRVLYEWLPYFDRFRGTAKFIFPAALMLAVLAAHGMDRILREGVSRRALWVGAAAGLVLVAAAAAVREVDWRPLTEAMLASGQSYADPRLTGSGAFAATSRAFAALGLLLGGATLLAATVAGAWTRREPRAAFLLGVLAVAEVFTFARLHRPTFDSRGIVITELRDFLAAHPGDYRILNLRLPNSGMLTRTLDAWGYDPAVTKRYAELAQWMNGGAPDLATQYVDFHTLHPLLSMLRVKYVVRFEGNIMRIEPFPVEPLGRIELVGAYQLKSGRDAILGAMAAPSFDPRREVILERRPLPEPVSGSGGRATVVREGTDFLEIEAELAQPAVLLVTDAWTPGWRAVSLDPGRSYELMPADYALRAVALDRGRHRLRLEYAPGGLYAAAVVSAIAWAAWLGAALVFLRRLRFNRRLRTNPSTA